MKKLDLVRTTLENREAAVKDDLQRLVWDLEGLAKIAGDQHGTWSSKSLLDYAAGKLESLLRQARDLQARDLAAGELRSAYNFLVRED